MEQNSESKLFTSHHEGRLTSSGISLGWPKRRSVRERQSRRPLPGTMISEDIQGSPSRPQSPALEALAGQSLDMWTKSSPHPIVNCPDDILRIVFQWIVEEGNNNLEAACMNRSVQHTVVLSSVCRRWRLMALTTSSLWASLSLNHEALIKEERECMQWRDTIFQRLRNAPASVTVYNIGSHRKPVKDYHKRELVNSEKEECSPPLHQCGLEHIPKLQSLELIFWSIEYLDTYRTSSLLPFNPDLRKLKIRIRPKPRPYRVMCCFGFPRAAVGFDITRLLSEFKGITEASINLSESQMHFSSQYSLPSLRRLSLFSTDILSLDSLFAVCPYLEHLEISEVTDGAEGLQVVGTNLRELRVSSWRWKFSPWIRRYTFPKLERLTFTCNEEEVQGVLCDFLSRHSTLIELRTSNEASKALVQAAAHVSLLQIAAPLKGFYERMDTTADRSAMLQMFPASRHVIICEGAPGSLTKDDFELFARTRLLPPGHPQCLASEDSWRMRNVVFRGAFGEYCDFRDSELYLQATKRSDESGTRLSWPEWE